VDDKEVKNNLLMARVAVHNHKLDLEVWAVTKEEFLLKDAADQLRGVAGRLDSIINNGDKI
jgi:hypothetical protein